MSNGCQNSKIKTSQFHALGLDEKLKVIPKLEKEKQLISG